MGKAAETEKRITFYKSSHKILLVGEGDFSFALCLANAFGSASNIVATSLDSQDVNKDEVVAKYSKGAKNLKKLKELGCIIIHEVNAHTMHRHPLVYKHIPFDRIVFNFPHAPLLWPENNWNQILRHRKVVKGFLRSARILVSYDGEIHITHKTTRPYDEWEIEELAEKIGLRVVGWYFWRFNEWDYPGYINKKGSGVNCDHSFPVGQCLTYKFGF